MNIFAELAVTTNFSFLRGASHPEELVGQAAALRLAGIGVCDRNSVAGVVRAHVAAKEFGIRFVTGCRLCFEDGTPDVLAWPRDRTAFGRLTRLLTIGNRRAAKGKCLLALDDLLAWGEGMVLAPLGAPSEDGRLPAVLSRLTDTFGAAVRLAAALSLGPADRRRLDRLA